MRDMQTSEKPCQLLPRIAVHETSSAGKLESLASVKATRRRPELAKGAEATDACQEAHLMIPGPRWEFCSTLLTLRPTGLMRRKRAILLDGSTQGAREEDERMD